MEHERENINVQLYNLRGGDFPVFQGVRYIQYVNGFGDVLLGFLRHVIPVAVKGAEFFGEPYTEKGARTKFGKCSKTINSP